jgi:CheY-like chemotaxis protein
MLLREHVLVVDDVPDIRTIVAAHLDAAGYDVATQDSGEGLLAYVEIVVPDLILLDVAMPGIGGLEACRRLRGIPRYADVPVMFVTCSSDEVEKEARKLRADILNKPFKIDELLRRVDRVLGSQRITVPLRAVG